MMRPNAETGIGFAGAPTMVKLPSSVSRLEIGVDVVLGGDAVEDEVEAPGVLLHLVGVAGEDHLVGTEPQSVLLLAGRGREDDDVRPEAWANLTPMWPSPPRPTTPTFFPFDSPMTHRRIGCDPGAEERGGPGEIEIRGDTQDEAFVDDDAVGIAAISDRSRLVACRAS